MNKLNSLHAPTQNLSSNIKAFYVSNVTNVTNVSNVVKKLSEAISFLLNKYDTCYVVSAATTRLY